MIPYEDQTEPEEDNRVEEAHGKAENLDDGRANQGAHAPGGRHQGRNEKGDALHDDGDDSNLENQLSHDEQDRDFPPPPGSGVATEAIAEETVMVSDRSLYPWASDSAAESGKIADRSDTAAGDGEGEQRRRAEGVPSKLEALELPEGDYLSGCRVILVGFAAASLLPLSLLIRKGCGVR